MISVSLYFVLLSVSLSLVAGNELPCKCVFGGECWPDQETWNRFNASIGGRLVMPLPTNYYCHGEHYNAVLCEEVQQNYTNCLWRARHPATVQPHWEVNPQGIGCIGFERDTPCHRGSIPFYTVIATHLEHIVSTVNFAAAHNIRLVVKNSGHDFLGRSSGEGVLSLYTYNLKDVVFEEDFVPEQCHRHPLSVVHVSVGASWDEVYAGCDRHGKIVMGAGCGTVGAAGGYVLGGGYSPIGGLHGMAVDNVIQFKIVTPDGRILVVNECNNRDLWWALRGGGPGFGVLFQVTYKTHAAPNTLIGGVHVIRALDDASFRELFVRYTASTPIWSDQGWTGAFYVNTNLLILHNAIVNTNLSYAQSTWSHFVDFILQNPHRFVVIWRDMRVYPSWWVYFSQVLAPDSVNLPGTVFASRLVPRKNFDNPESIVRLADATLALQRISRDVGSGLLLGIMVGGRVSQNAGLDMALSPAWRKAMWHLVAMYPVPTNLTIAQRAYLNARVTADLQPLRDLTPGAGAYVNEVDPHEPDWQHVLFADHYPRLLRIKNRYDPTGMLICPSCVGSDEWTEDYLCRAEL